MTILNQQKPLNIVAVSGGLNNPSKTEALVQEILNELGEATPIHVHFIKFSEIGHLLGERFTVINCHNGYKMTWLRLKLPMPSL